MTISSNTLPVVSMMGRSLRILLATAAILVLATVSSVAFVVGRVTVSSSSAPAKGPVGLQVPASNDTGMCQHIGHFSLPAC